MLTEDQRMQMMDTGLANCFCAERSLTWSRSQLLTIVNLGGLPVLATQQVPVELRLFVGILGIGLCIFWIFVNRRMRKRINYWLDCLTDMEPDETNLIPFRVFTGKKSETIRRPPRVYAINLLPYMFLVIWVFVALITFFS